MNPLFATVWDANHVVIQWEGDAETKLRVAYRAPGKEWTDWIKVGLPWPVRSINNGRSKWFKIPTQRQNCLMRAQVWDGENFQFAQCAEIVHVTARFRLQTGSVGYKLNIALPFACPMRGSVAAFVPLENRIVPPESTVDFDARSSQKNPFNQLGEPGEFTMRPCYEGSIANLAESTLSLKPVGGTESLVTLMENPGGPQPIVLGGRLTIPA